MPLDEYRRKRDFSRTPEPSGDPTPGSDVAARADDAGSRPATFPGWERLPIGSRFCVQMHRATRMHFDLRLEHNGVLLSWAVPRGPSLDPKLKRMAVHVEDHPIDYGQFEGVIPDGYGMGSVELWDAGTMRWTRETADDVDASLRKGDVKFALEGVKLRGEFVLVHTGGRHGKEDDKNWLLIKKRDAYAVDGWEALEHDVSVKTGRTLDEIAAEAGGDPRQNRRAHATRARAPRAADPDPPAPSPPERPMPAFVTPMLAVTVDKPFSNPEWLYELKYDGVRVICRLENGDLTVHGRSGRSETARYPEAQRLRDALSVTDAMIDGEIVALDDAGVPSFERLQQRINVSRARDIERAALAVPASVVVFDLLFAGGRDLRDLPLVERKQRLRALVRDVPGVIYADHVIGDGEAFFAAVQQRGLEGMMAKRLDSPYRAGVRAPWWAKCKAWLTQDAVICGFTAGRGGRGKLGSLVLGVQSDGHLVHAGQVGSGLDAASLTALLDRLGGMVAAEPTVVVAHRTDTPVTWVRPELVCEVRHAGWTNAMTMRHPTFRGLRPDVPPAACVRDRPETASHVVVVAAQSVSTPPAAPSTPPAFDGGLIGDALGQLARLGERGGPVHIDGRTLRITNPGKVYWPESGITKRDMIAHYLRMAPLMLPYLRDRPIGMQMFPDGINGKHFWRKDRPPHTPDWVPTWVHERGPKSTTYIVADHPATLGFVANLGAIDIHPWHSRIDAPDQPDWAVFDLDPFEPMTFAEVVEIARLVKASLDFYALHSVIKTSGQTGLQIYVPLRRGPGYDRVRGWVEEVARAIGRIVPDKITWHWEVARRGGKLRIDYTQNILNKTLTAPYSVRPEQGAPVSAPIGWEELDDPALRPNRWTIATIGKRIAERGDLFVQLLTQDQDLPGAA